MKYMAMTIKYGYVVVEAENEEEALDMVKDMPDNNFDWSDPDDVQIVEEIDYE